MKALRGFALLIVAGGLAVAPGRAAADCTASDFSAAVERSAQSLRDAAREFQPKLQERLKRYQKLKNMPEAETETAALGAIQDGKLEELDARSSELLLKIDGLGRIPDGKEPVCAELEDIDKRSRELLSTVREKSTYMLMRLDAKLAELEPKKAAPEKDAAKEAVPKEGAKETAKEAAKEKEKVAAMERAPPPAVAAPAPPSPANQASREPENWAATTKPGVAPAPPADAVAATPPTPAAGDDGYTIEEIQDATRGFFGPISTSLASVIEHAFQTSGRPAAYVLGTEGGGAFLAGLRFGEGTLFMRNRSETRKVWWHGPSIGGDIGASGARTMFLIYHLENEDALYRQFTGLDGSAFFVGGVGMTVLKGGDVIMAPIRTGLGFRVGASVGYVKFTPRPTWNPF